MKSNLKRKIPHTVLERRTLRFSSYKNRILKVKLWWVGARKEKKRTFFVSLILSEETCFNICVLSQCVLIEYTFRIFILLHIHHTSKSITSYLLGFEIVESLLCILKQNGKKNQVLLSITCTEKGLVLIDNRNINLDDL